MRITLTRKQFEEFKRKSINGSIEEKKEKDKMYQLGLIININEEPKMIYEDINGWFDFSEIYDMAIQETLDRKGESNFVEVGAWLGRSTAYMAEKLKNIKEILDDTGIKINFFVYDTWQGGGDQDNDISQFNSPTDNIFHLFYHNLYELKDYFIPRVLDTFEACKLHDDKSNAENL